VRLKRPRWLFAVGGGVLLLLYAPIAMLTAFSFNEARYAGPWTGFTLEWYRRLSVDGALHDALINSLLVAGVSTGLATLLGLGAAVGLERSRMRGRSAIETTLTLLLVVPEVMLGVGLLLWFVLLKIPLGLTTVILAHTAFNLPLVTIMIRARLRRLDAGLEDAARDLGASPWAAFCRVTLPLLAPAVAGAALMAFTVSLDDFIVTFFTAGPGATTLPLKVYSMIKAGVSPEINALSTLLVLVSMGLVALSLWLQERGTVRSER
jgi:spermidine/putrescine transport system permease protein